MIGLLGPNGGGKTTLLRAICGELPHDGHVFLEGAELAGLRSKELARRVSYIPQQSGISISMSAIDVVLMGFYPKLKLLSQPSADMRAAALRALEQVGMAGLADRDYLTLSGGEKQLVILARTLVEGTKLLLFDEPDSSLDLGNKYRMVRMIMELVHGRPGKAGLICLHDPVLALACCDTLMLLKDGKTLIFGDTRKLFEQPQLLEAARLTGCKNSSRIERMGEYQVFALDWGISLRTEQKVELDMTHIAIRGHWIRPSEKAGENCLVFEAAEYVETTFEHQYLVKSPGMEDGAVLWWMRPKKSFTDEHDKKLPKYLYLPPEHLMLLK